MTVEEVRQYLLYEYHEHDKKRVGKVLCIMASYGFWKLSRHPFDDFTREQVRRCYSEYKSGDPCNREVAGRKNIVEQEGLTGQECWSAFTTIAYSEGYTFKVEGDRAYRNRQGDTFRMGSCSDGRLTYYVAHKGPDRDRRKEGRQA